MPWAMRDFAKPVDVDIAALLYVSDAHIHSCVIAGANRVSTDKAMSLAHSCGDVHTQL